MTQGLERAISADGSVRLTAGNTAFVFARPKASVLVVTIAGYDEGRLGTAPLDEIGAVLRVAAPIELFVDARGAIGATVRVSENWTSFLSRLRNLRASTCSRARDGRAEPQGTQRKKRCAEFSHRSFSQARSGRFPHQRSKPSCRSAISWPRPPTKLPINANAYSTCRPPGTSSWSAKRR
jgi:hypothetical protein